MYCRIVMFELIIPSLESLGPSIILRSIFSCRQLVIIMWQRQNVERNLTVSVRFPLNIQYKSIWHPQIREHNDFFPITQPKHAVGTEKKRLNETVLLSTQSRCLNLKIMKKSHFYARKCCLALPMLHMFNTGHIRFCSIPGIYLLGLHMHLMLSTAVSLSDQAGI